MPQGIWTCLLWRDVNDKFLLFPSEDHFVKCAIYLKSKYYNIKFTCKKGSFFYFPFVDIPVFRSDNESFTSVYLSL